MKSIFKSITLLILISNMSCKNEINSKNENIVSENDKNMISEVLKKQLKEGAKQYISEAGIEMPKKKFENIELDAILQIVKDKLAINGYKVISDDEFKIRVEKVFKRIIDFKSQNKFLYINFLDKCNKDFSMQPSDKIDFYGTYIIKSEKFITDFYFIPQLVDYQKEYPEVAKIENSLPSKMKNENGTECSIEFWNEIDDLSNQRQSNVQTIVNRNKYLFNDNKASLTWLKANDSEFLEKLVKTFGYLEDKELTKFVLDKSLKDNEEFGKVIWTKTCEGKLHFNEDIIKTIKDAPNKYIEPVKNYLGYLFNTENTDLKFSEKAEVMGKLAYHFTKIVGDESDNYFDFFPLVSSEEFQNEFESMNYYKIKDFKSLYFETKTGGVAYPGME